MNKKWRILQSILLVLLLGWYAVPVTALALDDNPEKPAKQQKVDQRAERANRPLAVVRKFKPDVYVKHEGGDQWVQAKMGEQLYNSDSLRTTDNGFAAVQFMDNSIIKIKPNSLLVLNGEVRGKDDTSTRLAMEVGEIFLQVTQQKSDFEVATPTAVASVKGTEFGTNVNDDGSSDIYVFEGRVNVTPNNGRGQGKDLSAGMFGNVDKDGNNMNTGQMSSDQMKQLQNSFNDEGDSDLKTLKFQFIDENGQQRTIEIKYNQNEDNE
ncbi:MAG: FecR family protein [Bacteroidota bacterium]